MAAITGREKFSSRSRTTCPARLRIVGLAGRIHFQDLLDVRARDEIFLPAGQDDGLHAGVFFNAVEDRRKFIEEVRRDLVDLFPRLIEPDHGHAVASFHLCNRHQLSSIGNGFTCISRGEWRCRGRRRRTPSLSRTGRPPGSAGSRRSSRASRPSPRRGARGRATLPGC